jgi:phosphatidylserine/phosphatidylglycerophosphate/cardiolipin synthase-like enzyme
VHHNFVQRWNEASERSKADGTWGIGAEADMAFPVLASAPRGTAIAQVQRTIHAGLYADGHPSPGAAPYPVAKGEWTVLKQYKQAIDAARQYIQIENQSIPVPEVTERLDAALARGVEVVLLVPGEPEAWVRAARVSAERRPHFEALASLAAYPNFTLAGLAGPDGRGSTYVHTKAMLVDDAWATIGSCNLHPFSLYGHGEMNASFRDPQEVRRLRCALVERHTGRDTAHLDGKTALQLYAKAARSVAVAKGEALAPATAFALDPAGYGT